jgi:hypothetical protein
VLLVRGLSCRGLQCGELVQRLAVAAAMPVAAAAAAMPAVLAHGEGH